MVDDVKLKACPFCGGALIQPAALSPSSEPPEPCYGAVCTSCIAEGPLARSAELANAAWNTRAIENALRGESFQSRVQPWMLACFGAEIAADRLERSDRFIEEALELVQACDYDRARAHALVDYVFDRPVGEPHQEVGGVMVTLAALCLASGLDMHEAGETELTRINAPETIAKIRAKQAAKPTGSALPAPATVQEG